VFLNDLCRIFASILLCGGLNSFKRGRLAGGSGPYQQGVNFILVFCHFLLFFRVTRDYIGRLFSESLKLIIGSLKYD
jgi:hypothetical protein